MQETRWLMKITVLVSCLRLCESQYSQGQYCDVSFTVMVPKFDDCSTYFRCVNSRWRDYKCPAGGVFSTEFGMCTRPEHNPRCKKCIYPCPEDGSVYMYPKWGTCDQFYVCKDRQLYTTACSYMPPWGTYRFFNFFMFSCDRELESNNVCWRSRSAG